MAEDKREGPLKVGQIFMSKYEIVSLIGQGGHAFVYEARHRFMRHVVALKILHRDGGVSDDMLRRGQVEAQVQKRIKHENIVQVDDADITDDRQLYIVMERLRGRSWRDALLDVGRFSVDEVLALAAQAADGLHAAHGHGVIHRDVKPDNVFLTRDNGVKLLDFGIAKVADVAAWATQKDMVLGTIYYMSPEQVLAKPLTPRTDMYSLGIMMIEALLGEHPVPRLLGPNEPSLYSFTRIIATESLRPLDELDPRIPRYVADLIATLTAKKANDRLGTMGDVAAACRECLARYGAEARQRGVSLQARDLSRATKASSGVELKTGDPRRAIAENAVGAREAHDTEPASQPLSFGGMASDLLTVRRDAPTVVPAPSERPTMWVKPGGPAQGAAGEGMRTEPLGSPRSRPAPAPQAAPPSPRQVAAPVSTPSSGRRDSAVPSARPVAAPLAAPLVKAAPPVPAEAPSAPVKNRGFTLQRALVAGAAVGFVTFGAAALYLTRAQSPEPASALSVQPPTQALEQSVAAPSPPSPVVPPPPAETAAAEPSMAAPSAAPTVSSAPQMAPSARPATANKPSGRALTEVGSGLPFADEGATPQPKPAAKTKPTDKMDERMRRLEKDLDQKAKPWWEGE